MDKTTLFLFNFFPREVGLPARRLVYNLAELEEIVEIYNGVKPIFVSLYDTTFTIDKVWFDIDCKEDVEKAFNITKKLVDRLENYGFSYIPVFSGRKGFHVYVPVKKFIVGQETAKTIIYNFQDFVAGDLEVDRHGFGNIRALVRLPNTLNQVNYCTYLPYDFKYWSIDRVISWSKEKHEVEYKVKRVDIRKYVFSEQKGYMLGAKDNASLNQTSNNALPSEENVVRFLAGLLKPCIHHYIIQPEPPHDARAEMVAELRELGYSEEEVENIIAKLHWKDYNKNRTHYHVHYTYVRKLKPASCQTIRRKFGKEVLNICKICGMYAERFMKGEEVIA